MSKRANPLNPAEDFATADYNDVVIDSLAFLTPFPVRIVAATSAVPTVVYERGLLLSFNATDNVFEGMTNVTNTLLPTVILLEEIVNTNTTAQNLNRIAVGVGHFRFDKLLLFNSTTLKCVPVTDTSLPPARIVDLIQRNIIVHRLLK